MMENRKASCDYQVDKNETEKKEDENNKFENEIENARVDCKNVDQDFCNKTTLKMHMRTVHLKEQRFSCGECKYNLAKLDDGLDESPTVMVGDNNKKRHNSVTLATFVYGSSQGQRTHPARTKINSSDINPTMLA
jgi:hypothetical protein